MLAHNWDWWWKEKLDLIPNEQFTFTTLSFYSLNLPNLQLCCPELILLTVFSKYLQNLTTSCYKYCHHFLPSHFIDTSRTIYLLLIWSFCLSTLRCLLLNLIQIMSLFCSPQWLLTQSKGLYTGAWVSNRFPLHPNILSLWPHLGMSAPPMLTAPSHTDLCAMALIYMQCFSHKVSVCNFCFNSWMGQFSPPPKSLYVVLVKYDIMTTLFKNCILSCFP